MRSVKLLFVVLLLPMSAMWQAPVRGQQAGGYVLYEGARLITGDPGPAIEDSAFVVSPEGRISAVGRRGEVTAPPESASVDLRGKTVIPGLIDAHQHVGYQNMQDASYGPKNYVSDNILDQLQRAAYGGIVAVWSAGWDFGEVTWQIRDAVAAGEHPNAAFFFSAGPALTTPDTVRVDNGRQSTYAVETAEQGRHAMRQLAVKGVKVAKSWVNGGGGLRSSIVPMQPYAYSAFIDEAHKHGMRVAIHTAADQVNDLVAIGKVDILAHMQYTEELTNIVRGRVAESPFYIMTTCPGDVDWLTTPPALVRETTHPLVIKRLQDSRRPSNSIEMAARIEQTAAQWRELLSAGAQMIVGSDGGGGNNQVPWSTHLEMEELSNGGFTPAQIITAATKTAAEAHMLPDLGTLSIGKIANFVVLDANPLDDIRNTRQIDRVFLRGKEVDRAALRAKWARWFSSDAPT